MATQTNKDLFLRGFAKLLREKWHTDVKLKAGDSDHCVSAHKLVLAARSEVFKKMLESDKLEAFSAPETITLLEMKYEELESLVKFMYSDVVSVSSTELKKHVRSLYLAADKYKILHLQDLCRNELISSLNLSNALDILVLSQIPLDKPLNDAVLSFIARNIYTIVDCGDFRLFVAKNPNLAVQITKAFLNPMMDTFEDDSDDDFGDDYEDDSDDY